MHIKTNIYTYINIYTLIKKTFHLFWSETPSVHQKPPIQTTYCIQKPQPPFLSTINQTTNATASFGVFRLEPPPRALPRPPLPLPPLPPFIKTMAFPLPLLRNCPADPNDLRSLCLKARDVFFPSSRGLYHMEFLGKQNSKTWRWKKVESKESYWNANSNLAEFNPKSWISGQWTVRHVGLPNKNMSAWFVILVLAACI